MNSSEEFRLDVEAWFRSKLDKNLSLDALGAPKGTGFSNDTFFARIQMPDSQVVRYVVRREALSNPIFTERDNSIQYKVIQALGKSGEILVPKLPWVEMDKAVLGAPFCVMEHIEGLIPTDDPLYNMPGSWVSDASAAVRERLWWNGLRAMVPVHQFDWQQAGLSSVLQPTPGGHPLKHELAYYERLYHNDCEPHYRELINCALSWAKNHMPEEKHTGLCWGDARLGNIIFRDAECVGLLDWEQTGLGTAEKDLAWWLLNDRYFHEGFGVERQAGWPTHEKTVMQYGQWLGRPMENMRYYMVVAAITVLIIVVRLMSTGFMPAPASGTLNPAAQLLERVLLEAQPSKG